MFSIHVGEVSSHYFKTIVNYIVNLNYIKYSQLQQIVLLLRDLHKDILDPLIFLTDLEVEDN